MAAKILTRYKQDIKELTLQPSQGGCFEVTLDDALIYSKLATGKFPDESAILQELQARG